MKIGSFSRSPAAWAVDEALKNGLHNMLGGTFPVANVWIKSRDGGSGKTINIGGNQNLGNWCANANYIINRPPCWTHTNWEN